MRWTTGEQMTALLALSDRIDRINRFIGTRISVLILIAILVSAGNATIRKTFDMSSNAWLELQWYLFGTVFLLAAAYALLRNDHIRIDVLSSTLSKRTRDWIDLVCHVLFLLPFAVLMVYLSVPWVLKAIAENEMSPNAGGLVRWPAKSMLLIGFALLTLQAVSEIIKRWAVIRGLIDDPLAETAAADKGGGDD